MQKIKIFNLIIIFMLIYALEGALTYTIIGCTFFSHEDDMYLCKWGFRQDDTIARDICDQYDPYMGWSPKPNCTKDIYTTDKEGYRIMPEFNNTGKIAIIGNSFTWGEDVGNNETFPYYLSILLNKSVINAGVHGYSPVQFYLYYKLKVQKENPDMLIIGLYLPDIFRVQKKFISFYMPYIDDNFEIQDYIPSLEKARNNSLEIRHKLRFLIWELVNRKIRVEDISKDADLTLFLMEKIRNEFKGKMLIVLIPDKNMVKGNNLDFYGQLPKFQNNIYTVMIHNLTVDEYPGHLNKDGNLKVAKQILEAI